MEKGQTATGCLAITGLPKATGVIHPAKTERRGAWGGPPLIMLFVGLRDQPVRQNTLNSIRGKLPPQYETNKQKM